MKQRLLSRSVCKYNVGQVLHRSRPFGANTTTFVFQSPKAGHWHSLVPYANADEANHAPNENLKLDLFIAGIKTGAALLTKLGEMTPGS